MNYNYSYNDFDWMFMKLLIVWGIGKIGMKWELCARHAISHDNFWWLEIECGELTPGIGITIGVIWNTPPP